MDFIESFKKTLMALGIVFAMALFLYVVHAVTHSSQAGENESQIKVQQND